MRAFISQGSQVSDFIVFFPRNHLYRMQAEREDWLRSHDWHHFWKEIEHFQNFTQRGQQVLYVNLYKPDDQV